MRLDFFVFDVRNSRTNEPLSINEKEEIAESSGFKMAEIILKTRPDEIEEIKRVINDLDSKRIERIVFKDIEMKIDPLKHTTSSANTSDLRYAFRFLVNMQGTLCLRELPEGAFRTLNLVRAKRGSKRGRCLRLGKAILEPIVQSIKEGQ